MIVMTVAFFVSRKVERLKVSSFHGHSEASTNNLSTRETRRRFTDLMDVRYLDLYSDEHEEERTIKWMMSYVLGE